jgi:hypothetical protein
MEKHFGSIKNGKDLAYERNVDGWMGRPILDGEERRKEYIHYLNFFRIIGE